jgi:hypothetical protein
MANQNYQSVARYCVLAGVTMLILAESALPLAAQAGRTSLASLTHDQLPAPTTIAEGTSVLLAIKQTLKSGTAKKGDQVLFEVAADAFTPDRRTVLIAKGSPAFGTVEQSRGAGPFGRSGSLQVRFDHLVLTNGARIQLRPESPNGSLQGRNQSGASFGTGLAVGAMSGLAIYSAAAPVFEFGTPSGRGSKSVSGIVGAAFVGTALITSALIRGGNATIREGKLFEALTAVEVPLPEDVRSRSGEFHTTEKP